MPVLSGAEVEKRENEIRTFIEEHMVDGEDYGPGFPGSKKRTLLNPGADKLLTFFGLQYNPRLVDKVQDWNGPLFYYRYRAEIMRDGVFIAAAEGSCNTRESKYRWRQAPRVCPLCGKTEALKKSKKEGEGWYCWAKLEGCGATFREDDPGITEQVVGRVENPDVFDQINTVEKMAQKRAKVAGVIIATATSNFFTQDAEDTPGYDNRPSTNDSSTGEDVANSLERDRPATKTSQNRAPARNPNNATKGAEKASGMAGTPRDGGAAKKPTTGTEGAKKEPPGDKVQTTKHPPRPWTPGYLRNRLNEVVDRSANATVEMDPLRGRVIDKGKVIEREGCTPATVFGYLVGPTDPAAMNVGQLIALDRWLDVRYGDDGTATIQGDTLEECKRIEYEVELIEQREHEEGIGAMEDYENSQVGDR
jgi:hypothetical protein